MFLILYFKGFLSVHFLSTTWGENGKFCWPINLGRPEYWVFILLHITSSLTKVMKNMIALHSLLVINRRFYQQAWTYYGSSEKQSLQIPRRDFSAILTSCSPTLKLNCIIRFNNNCLFLELSYKQNKQKKKINFKQKCHNELSMSHSMRS